jgi:hypothetical protein
MGAGSSSDSGADNEPDDVIGREYGFRVHRVEPGSPGAEAGLQSILDYIVVANGVRLNQDDASFVRMIAESKDKPLKLTVFDTHTLRTRETTLTPNDTWGGSGLVGITIRFDLAQSLSKHTLHVLDVFEDSPASAAQLDAFNDYILGVGDLLFDGPDEFGEIVLHNEHRPLRLFVYSVRTQLVREVVITPDRGWGGDGCLGCGVGGGYLHTLPRRRETRPHKARPDAAAPASAAPATAPATAPPPRPPQSQADGSGEVLAVEGASVGVNEVAAVPDGGPAAPVVAPVSATAAVPPPP